MRGTGGGGVLDRIAGLPQTRLHELLPWNWKAERRLSLVAEHPVLSESLP